MTEIKASAGWALLALVLCGSAEASTITFTNVSGATRTYTVTYNSDKGSGTLSFSVANGSTAKLGGPTGVDGTAGAEISSYTVNSVLGFSGTVGLEGIFLESPIASTQSALILAAADTISSTYGFFDYAIPNYQELLANANFTFAGLNASGFPILNLASNPSIQMTDATGQLLPLYRFTGPTETVGSVSAAPVPEPSTIAFFTWGGVLIVLLPRLIQKTTGLSLGL